MTKEEKAEKSGRRAELQIATQSVIRKHHTFGPCHFCEWPITHCFVGPPIVAVCELCHDLVNPGFFRSIGDEECPACAI